MARSREKGQAVALEAVVIIPATVLLVVLVVVLARDALAHQAVGAAAAQAARATSLERAPHAGRSAAEAAVDNALSDAGIFCHERQVTVDAAGLSAPLGTVSSVSVSVTCVISHEVSLPGFPRTVRVAETRVSPVDTYRGR